MQRRIVPVTKLPIGDNLNIDFAAIPVRKIHVFRDTTLYLLTEYDELYSLSDIKAYPTTFNNNRLEPVRVHIPDDEKIQFFESGRGHCLVVTKQTNSVYGWGENTCKEIALEERSYAEPTLIPKSKLKHEFVKKIRAGVNFSIFLTQNKLLGCGWNIFSPLGNIGKTVVGMTELPITFNRESPIKKIYCGYAFTLALLENGKVFGTGDNDYGQLGTESAKRVEDWIQITTLPHPITKISTGQFYSYFTTIHGDIYACGLNNSNMVSAETSSDIFNPILIDKTNIKKIACGDFFCFLQRKDDLIYKIGSGGELTIPAATNDEKVINGQKIVSQLLNPAPLFGNFTNSKLKIAVGSSTVILYAVPKETMARHFMFSFSKIADTISDVTIFC